MKLLESLNPAQKEAASHIDGALLILAGAGSGKTKTLTTRLAYLLHIGIPSENTLTLTFTNKAAKEMKERAIALIHNHAIQGHKATTPLLCTFHKFGLLFLQRYIHVLNRSSLFNVIDEDDKRKILKNLKKNHIQNKILPPPSQLSDSISFYKNQRLSTINLIEQSNEAQEMIEIYQQYQDYLITNNLLDFDDLLLLPYRILHENQELCIKVSQKYQYIMVDEYQDTNDLQVALLKELCKTHNNICVVGDDDQSIYSWRGANIRNILDFAKDFPNPKIVKLEQNYRSTKKILDIANNLITHNKERHDKTLKAIKLEGNEVKFLHNPSDKEEMQKIIESIYTLSNEGEKYEDIAILFRLNGLSRNVEQCLNRAKIPFKMIGVFRFYERQEIKDVIAYLRLALNPNDNFSFTRTINQPKRGIGEKTLQNLLMLAKETNGIYDAFKNGCFNNAKCYNKLKDFFAIIESLQDCIATNPRNIYTIFKHNIKLYSDDEEKDLEAISNEERRQNIEELFAYFDEFIAEKEKQNEFRSDLNIVQDFLNDIALSSSSDEVGQDCVKCMSVHNSKGLEFKHVFVIGLEDGLFPLRNFEENFMQTGFDTNLAEERRLAYVAFTRAKDTLTLSYVKNRFYRNGRRDFEPSPFLLESGVVSARDLGTQDHLDNTSPLLDSKLNALPRQISEFKKGDCVQHKIFGFGRIESLQGSGNTQKATINFGGTKRVILTSFVTKI